MPKRNCLLIICLPLLFSLSSATAAQDQTGYTDVTIIDQRTPVAKTTILALKLVVFDPPGHFREGQPVAGTQPLPWQDAFRANDQWGDYSFPAFTAYMTKEAIARYHLEPQSFDLRKKNYQRNRPGNQTENVLWALYCRTGGRELVFCESYPWGWLAQTPQSPRELNYAIGTDVYEKVDGVWKNQVDTEDVIGISARLPFSDRGWLTELLKLRKGVLDRRGRIYPEIEDAQPPESAEASPRLTPATAQVAPDLAAYTDVTIIDRLGPAPTQTIVPMQLVVFDPPGHFIDGRPAGAAGILPWQKAFPPGPPSPHEVGLKRSIREKASITNSLWVLYCRLGDRDLAFWVTCGSAWINHTPIASQETAHPLTLSIYEKTNGVWDNITYKPAAIGICRFLPLTDRESLTELLKAKRGVLGPRPRGMIFAMLNGSD